MCYLRDACVEESVLISTGCFDNFLGFDIRVVAAVHAHDTIANLFRVRDQWQLIKRHVISPWPIVEALIAVHWARPNLHDAVPNVGTCLFRVAFDCHWNPLLEEKPVYYGAETREDQCCSTPDIKERPEVTMLGLLLKLFLFGVLYHSFVHSLNSSLPGITTGLPSAILAAIITARCGVMACPTFFQQRMGSVSSTKKLAQ